MRVHWQELGHRIELGRGIALVPVAPCFSRCPTGYVALLKGSCPEHTGDLWSRTLMLFKRSLACVNRMLLF